MEHIEYGRSGASVRMHGNSDLDIIVVSPAFEGKDIFHRVKMVKGVHRALVETLHRPVDLLFYSDSEWAKGEGIIVEQVKKDLAAAP
jgi:stress-induced morphogen